MIDINLMTDFFMWLSIINISFIIFMYAILYFAFDLLHLRFKKIYMGSKEDFNRLLIQIFLQYRILTVFFAVLPYITLLIIKN